MSDPEDIEDIEDIDPENPTWSELSHMEAEAELNPFELAERQGLKITELPLSLTEMIDQLQEFDRGDLRRIAYAALLRSDGPDKFKGAVDREFIVSSSAILGERDNPQFVMWRTPED